jgi:hypothetical protein
VSIAAANDDPQAIDTKRARDGAATAIGSIDCVVAVPAPSMKPEPHDRESIGPERRRN